MTVQLASRLGCLRDREPDGALITGSELPMDAGVTASYFYGDLTPSLIRTAPEQGQLTY